MQASSVAPFNDLFQQLEQQRLINQVLSPTGKVKEQLTYGQVFNLAEQQYTSMSEASAWTGLQTKGSDSAFKAMTDGEKKSKCFNCGGDHWLRDCDKPKDEKRIKENRNNNNNTTIIYIKT